MRTLIVVSTFLGLAVSGCAESQPAYVPAVDPIEIEMSDESTCETDQYFVGTTNTDGSRVIQYQVEILSPKRMTFVDGNGQETVRTQLVSITEGRVAIVPPGEDIAEFLQVPAGGKIVPFETASVDVEPAPAPPAPSAD